MQFQLFEKLWLGVLIVVAVVFGFWIFNPFPLYFLNDDLIHIPLSKEGVLFQRNSLRPLGDLSIQMDYLLWKKNAAGYHVTNLVLHVVNSFLVFYLTQSLIRKYGNVDRSISQSLLTAVLFFIYAFHSETVFWILGRSGSLGTLFFLPAFIFYLHRFNGKLYFFASLMFFACGLFAYESVWIFPIVLVLVSILDRKLFKTSLKKDIAHVVVVFMVFLFYLLLRYNIINEVAGSYEASAFFGGDITTLIGNFLRLAARCFLPPLQSSIQFILALSLLIVSIAVLVIGSVVKWKKPGVSLLVVLLLAISFLPYLSLGISIHHIEGERYLYMPSIFACILLVELVFHFSKKVKLQVALFSALVCYNLYFLNQSSKHYSTASKISKTTYQQINLLQGKSRLFIDSLPQTVHGALVFRLGFDEGADWLKNANTADTIFILSVKQNNNIWSPHFKVEEVNPTPKTFTSILVRDSTHRQTYVERIIPATTFNQPTDAYFIYKDDGLEIIK